MCTESEDFSITGKLSAPFPTVWILVAGNFQSLSLKDNDHNAGIVRNLITFP